MASVKRQSRGPVSRRPPTFLPVIELDREAAVPLYQQISTQIAAAARKDGRVGDRLPSTRLLARMLGLSRNTIVAAYDVLVADGVIQGRIGSRMTVTDLARPIHGFDPQRVMRDAMYPARTLPFEDPDGAALYLVY